MADAVISALDPPLGQSPFVDCVVGAALLGRGLRPLYRAHMLRRCQCVLARAPHSPAFVCSPLKLSSTVTWIDWSGRVICLPPSRCSLDCASGHASGAGGRADAQQVPEASWAQEVHGRACSARTGARGAQHSAQLGPDSRGVGPAHTAGGAAIRFPVSAAAAGKWRWIRSCSTFIPRIHPQDKRQIGRTPTRPLCVHVHVSWDWWVHPQGVCFFLGCVPWSVGCKAIQIFLLQAFRGPSGAPACCAAAVSWRTQLEISFAHTVPAVSLYCIFSPLHGHSHHTAPDAR